MLRDDRAAVHARVRRFETEETKQTIQLQPTILELSTKQTLDLEVINLLCNQFGFFFHFYSATLD